MLRSVFLLLLIVGLASSGGCSSEPEEPWFDVGFIAQDAFVPIADGQDCTIVDGIQGGYWVMPTMRVTGLGKAPTISCQVIDFDDGDRVLADVEGPTLFMRSKQGDFLELLYLLSVVNLTNTEDFLGVEGHQGLLSCSATDGRISITREARVVLRTFRPGARNSAPRNLDLGMNLIEFGAATR